MRNGDIMEFELIEKYSQVDKVINKNLVIIVAKTHTCSACGVMNQMLEKNVVGLENIERYNIYVDDIEKFKGDHLIFSAPTVLIFSEGKELLRESRYINYAKISRLIEVFTS